MTACTIVVPCYNEAQRFPVDKFKAFIRDGRYERFIFVNDGSTDATGSLLEALVEFAPEHFRLCALPKNLGKAEAIRRGVLLALESSPEYVGYWDADLATPLETISRFAELLDLNPGLEMVFGSRVQLLGRVIERTPLRHYAGRIFATAASLVLGIPIYDTQCGAKLFRVVPTLRPLFEEPFANKWLVDVEIIARLMVMRRGTGLPQAEHVIYEFLLDEWRDVSGSKVRPRDFVKAFAGLARIYFRYWGTHGNK